MQARYQATLQPEQVKGRKATCLPPRQVLFQSGTRPSKVEAGSQETRNRILNRTDARAPGSGQRLRSVLRDFVSWRLRRGDRIDAYRARPLTMSTAPTAKTATRIASMATGCHRSNRSAASHSLRPDLCRAAGWTSGSLAPERAGEEPVSATAVSEGYSDRSVRAMFGRPQVAAYRGVARFARWVLAPCPPGSRGARCSRRLAPAILNTRPTRCRKGEHGVRMWRSDAACSPRRRRAP